MFQTWAKFLCMLFLWQGIQIKKRPYPAYPNTYRRKTIFMQLLPVCQYSESKFENTYCQTSWWNIDAKGNLNNHIAKFYNETRINIATFKKSLVKIFFFFFLIDRTNQFISAKVITDAHFVQKNLEQSKTCKIISEHILAKNHLLVYTVLMQQITKYLWPNILPKFTMKLPNLFNNTYIDVCWYYRTNQFLWAKEITDAHFVQKKLEQSNTCNIISEYIQAKNPFVVTIVLMHQVIKEIWTSILLNVTIKLE